MKLLLARARSATALVAPSVPPMEVADAPVNGHCVLEKVAALPVSAWRYAWEPPHVRHLGPMAQDFKAAFGLGRTDKAIAVVDAFGVALVAIQALHRRIEELEQKLDRADTAV
ncbi:hypothetical protein GCM10010218_23970 [Streptomyces mashuensis]|uniref:Peptidase S74 domain-containing protein n=1 Tax=Streptomyces mashuensis TaxID=33904 RepID=A0A919B1G2_9ACTN|nr:tail fiber domain-containing protein [Streptomyces mashuensis]GHF42068.1 hypothetical protein GCM10010218_23970 [Streptomyces mashuensis]